MKRLFLDDYRIPLDAAKYMWQRVDAGNLEYMERWDIVRNYEQFTKWITHNGLPDLVSFDHDLADVHYHENWKNTMVNGKVVMTYYESTSEKTGYDCAEWLVDYCIDRRIPPPKYFVHSQNPVGTENIMSLLENFNKSII